MACLHSEIGANKAMLLLSKFFLTVIFNQKWNHFRSAAYPPPLSLSLCLCLCLCLSLSIFLSLFLCFSLSQLFLPLSFLVIVSCALDIMYHSVQVLMAGHIILTPPRILSDPSFPRNNIAYLSVRFTVLFACVFSQDMLPADLLPTHQDCFKLD